MNRADTLANIERVEPAPVKRETVQGYWYGSATSQVTRERERRIAAERALEELRRSLGRAWVPRA